MHRGEKIRPNHIFAVTLVFFFSVLVSCVGAAEVVLDGNEIVIQGVDDSIGLGGFSIVLSYGSGVSISSVTGLSDFMVVNDTDMKRISGIYGGTEIKTGDIPVAEVSMTGNGNVVISVREIINRKGDAIPFSNPIWDGGDVVLPTPETPGTGVTTEETTASSVSPSDGGTSTSETSSPGKVDSTQTVSTPEEHTSVSGVTSSTTPEETTTYIAEKTPESMTPVQKSPLSLGGLFVAFSLVMILKRRINYSRK
jgi:hypothetical protein